MAIPAEILHWMSSPSPGPGEDEVIRAKDIYIKKFRFNIRLTTKRLILESASSIPRPPRSIPLSSITGVSRCRDRVSGEPCILLTTRLETGEQKQMRLIFVELGPQKRSEECDEWIRHLRHLTAPAAPPEYAPADTAEMGELSCPGCGEPIPGDSRFCPFCGKKIDVRGTARLPDTARTRDPGDLSYVYGKDVTSGERSGIGIDPASLLAGISIGFLAFFFIAWFVGAVSGVGMFADMITLPPIDVVREGQDLTVVYYPGDEVIRSVTVYAISDERGVVSQPLDDVEKERVQTLEGFLSNSTDFIAVTGVVEGDGRRLLLKRWL
ncbi:MAG: hypothetical protein ACXQTN_02645 [Methanoculleaceae archaeon]